MKKLIVCCLTLFVLSAGCTADTALKVIVASETADCVGVAPQKCLLIKEKNADDWTFWYSGIEGFDYEPGYEYVLEIRKVAVDNPPADASSLRYVLVKVVSKEKKTSEGMPPSVGRE
ncbi:DUF4377 domain-containing protein [uncultured Alistipes sp.]|jgi:hypothetical protein|uniref:DUF4377 domain-containing protein n=1 Tax=uncultured Alistipes sp. TaxID=538949 RepID=UPI0025DBFBD9|nr:DUF4377 domain-containing protein [uncultured Alistipes sp.]